MSEAIEFHLKNGEVVVAALEGLDDDDIVITGFTINDKLFMIPLDNINYCVEI